MVVEGRNARKRWRRPRGATWWRWRRPAGAVELEAEETDGTEPARGRQAAANANG
jgi:hypothetical protein